MMMQENLPPASGGGASANGGGSNGKPQKSSDLPSAKGTNEPLKCPRCDSTHTKFCYYNNYSLTQPRHFCKTCRRYWTKGGALRNVPVGGGCRKNKKVRSSSTPSSASRILTAFHDSTELGNITSAGIGGLKFFHGLTTPAVDFQLGGLRFPGFQSTVPTAPSLAMYPQLPSFPDISANSCGYGPNLTAGLGGAGGTPCTTSFLGLNNHPISTSTGVFKPTGETSSGGCSGVSSFLEMGSNNLATSIESLSSINQELHWKLQQQRLAMLYGQGQDQEEEPKEGREGNFGVNNNHHQIEKPQPILFQNLEISKGNDHHHHRHQVIGGVSGIGGSVAAATDGKEGRTSNSTAVATEWFFDNPYNASSSVGGRGVAHSGTPACTGGANGEGCDNDESGTTNFIQAWSNGNHHQFNGLP